MQFVAAWTRLPSLYSECLLVAGVENLTNEPSRAVKVDRAASSGVVVKAWTLANISKWHSFGKLQCRTRTAFGGGREGGREETEQDD